MRVVLVPSEALDGLDILLIGLDRRGAVASCNSKALALLGRSAAEVAGARFDDWLVDARAVEAALERLRAGGAPGARFEGALRAKDGDVHGVTWTLVSSDATASARAPEETRFLLTGICDRSDGRVEDATASPRTPKRPPLAREVSARKRKETRREREDALEAAVAAREQVLGYVAHDLGTPLNTILLHLHTLSHGDGLPPRARLAVDGIARAAHRMRRLVTDLVDVARADAGPSSVERAPVDVGALVREAVDALRPQAASASVTLSCAPSDAAHALGDRDRLLRVLDNLVGNAIKFSPPGGEVVVRTLAAGDDVITVVEDAGAGIAPSDLAHVFDRFWQARASDPRGSGLGLTIARGIVEAHGGRIWVESDVGRGARFCFSLPSSPAPSPTSAPPRLRSRWR